MDEAFYHCVTIRCGELLCCTTLGTLRKQQKSKLVSLFSDDFPLYDDTSDIHLMPLKYGVSGEAFSTVVDFLRCGEWPPILQQSLYQDILTCIERLELSVLPPPSPNFNAVDRKYSCMEVVIPGEGKGVGTTSCIDVCAGLGMRGYRVRKQLQGRILDPHKGTERYDGGTVTLLMERQLPVAPRLEALSSRSTWVNVLTHAM
ncbi:uncharacterized protein TM35_000021330 [Trypanosoma theileri]|uniref:Uncharacterized protein n=1 Tax=Trypanosoma theileri TaxID=67003 RepID=A0A1X0P786_9TRYP|nr:uncharacterized protein TM35_000021330 [Trypanosoma theileri]ORC92807.1 hypothetical protein TM35_000021330 [Trypanosoma theileri]